MARPFKSRRICALPRTPEFSPCGETDGGTVELALEEYEAVRLIDGLGFTQEECAKQMSVARATVQSVYTSARKKLADVIVCGKRLVIRGGSYDLCPLAEGCCKKSCAQKRCESDEPRCGKCPKRD